jgi:hypothetical protein
MSTGLLEIVNYILHPSKIFKEEFEDTKGGNQKP